MATRARRASAAPPAPTPAAAPTPASQGPAASSPAVRAFVEHMGSVLTAAGMPRLPSRVFARLLVDEDGRMTAAELSIGLEVSPAAISGAVRYLSQVHLIRRERERGSRKDVYVVMDDAWHDAMLENERVYASLRAVLVEGLQATSGADTPSGHRLSLSVAFLDFLTEEMRDIAARWEERKAELAGGSADGDAASA